MNNYHETLVNAVLKHTKEVILIDAWMQGRVMIKFAIGVHQGHYAGNKMLKLDTGGTIDFDPAKVTGVVFEDIIREEDAEAAFREIVGKNEELQGVVAKMKADRAEIIDTYERQVGGLETRLGEYVEQEKVFNAKLDALQDEMKAAIETSESDLEKAGDGSLDWEKGMAAGTKALQAEAEEDPLDGSEDTVSPTSLPKLDGQLGGPGLMDDTKEKAGIHEPPIHPDDAEKVTLTKDDIGTIDAADLENQ